MTGTETQDERTIELTDSEETVLMSLGIGLFGVMVGGMAYLAGQGNEAFESLAIPFLMLALLALVFATVGVTIGMFGILKQEYSVL